MTLRDLFAEKKTIILQRWFDRVLEAYPPDTQRFFRENKGPYSNPTGYILRRAMGGIIDRVLRPVSIEEDRAILEPVMKVRALENLPPSQGMRFILPLREVLSDILEEEMKKSLLGQEWLDLNSRINHLALLGISLYSECREKVNQLRMKEWERRAGEVRGRRFVA